MGAYEEQVLRLHALAVLDGYRIDDDRTDEEET